MSDLDHLYTPERRAAKAKSILIGVVIGFGILAASYVIGNIDLVTVALGAVLVSGIGGLLYWLFAAENSKPIEDPGPGGRKAAFWGSILGYWMHETNRND